MNTEDILIFRKLKNSTTNSPISKKSPHFDISAAVVKQLGEELVTDEVTALMELVKNAYDADATWVKIAINTKGVYSDSTNILLITNLGL